MMQLHKLCKHALELEQSGGGRGRVEAERLRGSQRWAEKGKGGRTMTCTEGVVLYRGRVYILDNPQLHHDLVHVHHGATVTGHPGRWKTLELVSWDYWWPGLSRYVAKFVAGCNACNQTKTFPTQKVGKLIPNKVPDRHWQVISIDMIRELLDSKG